jgi:CubicO group peptidase (beta-lactamase class C family)
MNTARLSRPLPHRARRRSTVLAAVLSASLVLPFAASAQLAVPQTPTAIEAASPESVGMSAARLDLITRAFSKEIDEKQLPGAVVMVARKGRLVYARAFGVRDPAPIRCGPTRSSASTR